MYKIMVNNPDFMASVYHKRAANYSLGIFLMFPTMRDDDFSANVFGHAAAECIILRAGVLCSRSVTS